MSALNPLETRLATIPVRKRTVNIMGGDTAVWEFGPEDARDSVVIVHGFRGTHHGLLSLVALLPEVRFVTPDLPGFGESTPMRGEHNLAGYAHWLHELLEREDAPGHATVLGHSFGSMIVARAVAELAPRDIVLVNPISKNALEGPERVLTSLAVWYYRLGAMLPSGIGHALLETPLITRVMSEVMASTRDRALRQWVHQQHHAHFSEFSNREVLLEAFRASVSSDVTRYAKDFPAGTTLVAGERDQIATPAAARRLHAAMPDARLHIIGGVGHLIHYETPKPLARIVREHLNRHRDT